LILAGAALILTTPIALAGMAVSLQRQFDRLMDFQRQIERLPIYRKSEELKKQISDLRRSLVELDERQASGRARPDIVALERRELQAKLDDIQRQLQEAQKAIVSFHEALSARLQGRFFPDARHRLAAFTFDDPHSTGLGDPISFLLSKKLLFSTRVASFAIVNYRQGTDHEPSGNLAYFDRVDAIVKDQKFPQAVWGRISRTEHGVRIDSFLQVPGDANKDIYTRSFHLPGAMGGEALTVRLKSDRVLVQSLDLDTQAIAMLRAAADQVAILREQPSASARPTGRLDGDTGGGESQVHSIIDSRGDWVQLRLSDGTVGWTNVDQFCIGVCRTLLDVADFTNDIVAIASGLSAAPVPRSVTREARAMAEQLSALVLLVDNPTKAATIAQTWIGDPNAVAPGGAGFANLLAVARVKAELVRAKTRERSFDEIRISRQAIEPIVTRLADASVADPSDANVVQNLAVLFGYLGDNRRRDLALQIAADLRAKVP